MTHTGTRPAAIHYVLFGLLVSALEIHLQEVLTAEVNLLPPPVTTGLLTDLLLILLAALPGHYGLRKLVPASRLSAWTVSAIALVPALLAFILIVVSDGLWRITGSMLSLGLLEYGFAELGHTESMASPEMLWNALKSGLVVLLAALLAHLLQRIRPYSSRSLLLLPLMFALLLIPFTAHSHVRSVGQTEAGYKMGHLSSFLLESWRHPIQPQVGSASSAPVLYQTPQISELVSRPNIIILVLESTRARSVGQQAGKASSQTPHFDALAQTSLRVPAAYTTTDHTSKALVGILCGMYPNPDFAIAESHPGAMKPSCLAKLLGEQGYSSLFLQSAPGGFERRRTLTANMGYQATLAQEELDSERYAKVGYLGMDDQALVDPAMDWMQKQSSPFFLTLLTSVTHHPYQLPSRVVRTPEVKVVFEEDPKQKLHNYEQTLSYTDQMLGRLVSRLREARLLDNTVLIVTGDHGEAFGEHGAYTHNGIPFAEVTHVPLLVHYPARYPQGGEIAGLRQHVDITPTVLDLLGAKWRGTLPGKSLLSGGHTRVLSHCWGTRRCASLRDDGEMLAYYYRHNPARHVDLRQDPYEHKPLLMPNTEPNRERVRYILEQTEAIEKYWQ